MKKRSVKSLLVIGLIATLILLFCAPVFAEEANPSLMNWTYEMEEETGNITLLEYIGTDKDVVVPSPQDFIDNHIPANDVFISGKAIHNAGKAKNSFSISKNGDKKVIYSDDQMDELFAYLLEWDSSYRKILINTTECTLKEIDLSNLDTSNVTSMLDMFIGSYCTESINLDGIDTSKVENMDGMFSMCTKLKSIDVSGFSTNNVKDMAFMFSDCDSLESLDVSNFDTSSVLDAEGMFEACENLKSLTLGENFTLSNATSIRKMFMFDNNLSSLDVSMMDTSNVEDMYGLFRGCSSLKSLDITNFDTSKVFDMADMFNECESLEEIDLSQATIPEDADLTDMCLDSGLKRIYIGSRSESLPERQEEIAFDGEFLRVLDSLKLDPSKEKVLVGNTLTLKVISNPENAAKEFLNFNWTSSNPSIAEVKDGTVTGKKVGTTTITVTAPNGLEASCTIEVISQTPLTGDHGFSSMLVFGAILIASLAVLATVALKKKSL